MAQAPRKAVTLKRTFAVRGAIDAAIEQWCSNAWRESLLRANDRAALHSCIVPRQFILPFTHTTSRQKARSADAPRVSAVESPPQKASAPARVWCDRLRPSKDLPTEQLSRRHRNLQ